ncbi:MAG TPA: hypothetical protein VNE40_00285 [Candidatus Dormibacteraeota bacterium]|nr:hypothetical protein [Candidatus Dormibacteraeota bacterium]
MYFGSKPYGLEEYLEHHKGDGSNMLRSEDFAQPRALTQGDILSNGWEVSGKPFLAFNSSTGLHFTNGLTRIVAPRIPLQLRSDRAGYLPEQLRIGQILQTGCVVLDTPKPIGPVEWHNGQDELELKLTGGFVGHEVGVPYDLELAVFGEEYPPNSQTLLGSVALDGVQTLYEEAKRNLPKLGQLAFEV